MSLSGSGGLICCAGGEAWDENGPVSPDGEALIVARGSQRLVNWRRQPVTVPSCHCWEIGIMLLPQARARGNGTQAHRLLARYLFAHTTVHRIWARTEVDNIAEQRAARGRSKIPAPIS